MNLIRVLLRTTSSQQETTQSLIPLLQTFGSWSDTMNSFTSNGWDIYLIGMEAGACGWYEVMHVAMEGLCKKSETESCFYWLSALSSLARAEWTLSEHQLSNAQHAAVTSNLYLASLTKLKALKSIDKPRASQSWFIQLRMEMLNNVRYTLTLIDSPSTNTKYMTDCAVRFRKLAFKYDFIAQAQYGVGKETLDVIESYKMCALVCEHAVRVFSSSGQAFFCVDPSLIPLIDEELNLVNYPNTSMIRLCKEFMKTINAWEELDHLEDKDRRAVSKEGNHQLYFF